MSEGNYRAGKVDQRLKSIERTLVDMNGKLDGIISHQADTDTNIAVIGVQMKKVNKLEDDVENLKDKDKRFTAINATIAGTINALGIAIRAFWPLD